MSARPHRAVLLPALLLAAGSLSLSCDGETERSRRIALLASRWSEASLDRRLPSGPIDLRDDVSTIVRGVDAPGAIRGEEGLEILASDEPFRLELLGSHHAAQELTVRLRADAPGTLVAAWRPGAHEGQRWRVVRRRLRPTGAFDDYRFDLENAILVAPHGFELELRLSAGAGEGDDAAPRPGDRIATIQTIDFAAAPRAEDAAALLVGKARLGRETRAAVAVPVGGDVRLPLPEGARRIELEVGRHAGGPAEATLTLRAMPSGTVVLEATLGPESVERWTSLSATVATGATDRELDLAFRAAGGAGEATPEPTWSGVALVANPAVTVAARERRPDVILLSMDTVGATEFEAALRDGRLPHLGRIARRGVRFTNARANSSVTSTSHAVLLSGRLPGRSGVVRAESGAVSPDSLAERLRTAGCSTSAFTGGVLVTERLGHDRGFEVFTREDTLYGDPSAQTDIEVLGGRFEAWLEAPSQGCRFLFLHTYEAHGPYLSEPEGAEAPAVGYGLKNVAGQLPFAPERLSELISIVDLRANESRNPDRESARSALDSARGAHRSEISRIDRVLGPLLERALDRSDSNGTIVAVTSDHGEAFFEHGLVEHTLLEESNLRVPLLLAGDGVDSAPEVDAVVRSVDVAPTLLELAGLEAGRAMDGRPLLDRFRRPSRAVGRSYAFTSNSGFSWEVGGRKWVTLTGLSNEDFGAGWSVELGSDAPEDGRALRRFEAPNEELARFALSIVDDLPGLHVDLSALHGREVIVEAHPEVPRSSLHGWDLEPIGEHEHGSRRRTLRAGENARLWLLLDRVRWRGIVLTDVASGSICQLDAGTDWDRAAEPAGVCDAEPWRGLRLSRGRGAVAGRDGSEPGEEESRRLRALGYIG